MRLLRGYAAFVDNRRAFAPIVVVGAVIALWMGIPWVLGTAEAARTQMAGETGLVCATGAGETTCSVSLAVPAAYADMTGATVTETAPGPGDRTGDSTMASSQTSIAVADLVENTSYTFDLVYPRVRSTVPGALDQALQSLQYILGIFGAAFVAAIIIVGLRRAK